MNINIKLDRNFTVALNKLQNELPKELQELNGFSESQMSYTDFIQQFANNSTVADATIDGNANVSTKDVCSLESEMHKPHSKLLAANKIFYEMCKKYGYPTANEWLTNEYDGHFYLHDFPSSSMKPYCYAYDLERLVKEGLFFIGGGFNSQPPEHLETYTDFVGEFVSWNSNRTAGACGLPNFLIYSYYFWKKDCKEGFYIKTPEYYRDQEFQRIIYKLNQPYLRINQSAFTNFSIFDQSYLVELFGGKEFPDGTFMVDAIDDIIEYQKRFMEILSDIRAKNAMTFPVMTMSLLFQNGRFVNEEFARWCCHHNMRWGDSNFATFDDVTSLSNCCRLRSDIQKLGFFNSIGGTALSVGSIKVNTLNLARLSYESKDEKEYLEKLRPLVKLNLKCLDVIRNIIKRNVDKGLLTNYQDGLIDMNHQYNTIGIIGVFETLERFKLVTVDEMGYYSYTEEGIDFAKRILSTIKECGDEFRDEQKVDYQINIEQVPAERAAAVLMKKDQLFYPYEKYTLPLYANQWIPLGVKCTIQEKVRISAILDKACSGGSIAHINIATPFKNFDDAWEALNFVAKAGCNYFAFCYRISICKSNHSFYGEVCPYCGGKKYTTVQRIVGFLVPERSYSKERKAEYALRTFFDW